MKFGVTELLIILAVVIVLFGPTQIPKLTKMVGKGVKNFRKGMADDEEEDDEEDDEKSKKSKKADKKSDKKADKKAEKEDKEDKEESDEEDA